MKVTAISPGADDTRETAPSPLSWLHPGHAEELASFLVFAEWVPEDLEHYDGDAEFTAQVQAAMRALQTAGGGR